jgi:hypothetical protein
MYHLPYALDSVPFFSKQVSLYSRFVSFSLGFHIYMCANLCIRVYVLACVSETLCAAFTEIREIYVLWVFVSLGFFFVSLSFVAKRLRRV